MTVIDLVTEPGIEKLTTGLLTIASYLANPSRPFEGKATMKRDMDLVRYILLCTEAVEHGYVNDVPKIDSYTEDQVAHHIYLMWQAGLVQAADTSGASGNSPTAILINVTWQGHDFLDAIRDPEIWKKTKDIAGQAGGLTVELMGDLAKGLLKTQIKRLTGIDL